MDLFKRTKGAISIFLVIILVPMMTVSALFVDASKVSLARSAATSAGDLALNTALTDYDTLLKDMYGLFATAQNTEELYAKLEDYYRTCITSSGISDEDADSYVDQIMAQLGLLSSDSNTSDILNMELIDFNVNKRSDATLANATILEKQLVDFMKYRAPINTGLSFLTSLQSFSTLSKQTELVDNRTEYYKQQQTVMEKLQEAWKNINSYNKTSIITDSNYFNDMKNNLNSNYQNQYKESINKKTIMDLYDTQDYINYYCNVTKIDSAKEKDINGNEKTVSLWKFTYTAISASPLNDYTNYYNKSVGGYDKTKLPTTEEIKTLMTNFYSSIQSMDAYKADIPSSPADVYDLQYLVQMMRGPLSNYTSNAKNVYTTYQQLKNAMIWAEAYDSNALQEFKNKELTINGSKQKLSAHFDAVSLKYDSVMAAVSGYAKTFSDISQNLPSGITNTEGVNTLANTIGKTSSKYVETLESAAKNLENASTLIKEAKNSVNGGDLETAKNTWKSTANSKELKNTSMAKQDLAEINQLGTYLNTEEMQKMINRLDKVSENLRKTADQIKNYKFDGKFIGEIQSYDIVKSTIESKVGVAQLKKVPLSKSALISQANNWFYWESGNINVAWINDSGTQVKLHGTGTDKLNFYSYLFTHFNSATEVSADTNEKTEDSSNGKSLYDNIKNKSSSAASGNTKDTDKGNITNSNEIKDQGGLPSKEKINNSNTASAKISTGESAAKDTSKSLGSMFSNLASAALNLGADLRDKLYVSDYILSMFSYDTSQKEYLVKNKDKTEAELQTLTLQPINKTNNFAFGNEVEYIIYGGSNASNLTKAYGSIYGIRLGFNLIYAFMDSSIRDSAFAIATPISAATLGVVPVPLIQAAIIVGIACCESAIDLNDIRNGESVPLFKTAETWHCSVNGLINEAKGIAGGLIKDATEYVIDEGTRKLGEVLDMTDGELTKYLENGTKELTGYIGDAYDTLITRHANTAIQKLTTLVTNAIEEHTLNSAINMTEYVSTGLDKWISEESAISDTSDIGFIVKVEAVKVIKNSFIPQFIDIITQANKNANSSVEDIGNLIKDKISEIRSEIVNTVTTTSEKVIAYKDDLMNSIKDSMNKGANDLKNTLNEKIDGIFGNGSVNGSDNTGISSLLSFSYSDYLRLFLMIGLYTNEEGVLLRTADVIQVNMATQTKNSKYRLNKSAVYVEISATIQVKPTLLALPLFADVEGNPSSNAKWYTIHYKDIKGY